MKHLSSAPSPTQVRSSFSANKTTSPYVDGPFYPKPENAVFRNDVPYEPAAEPNTTKIRAFPLLDRSAEDSVCQTTALDSIFSTMENRCLQKSPQTLLRAVCVCVCRRIRKPKSSEGVDSSQERCVVTEEHQLSVVSRPAHLPMSWGLCRKTGQASHAVAERLAAGLRLQNPGWKPCVLLGFRLLWSVWWISVTNRERWVLGD